MNNQTNNDTVNSAHPSVTMRAVWQHDVPAAADMTFMLATLQRIEQHRWRRSVLRLLVNVGMAALASWALWPWFSEALANMTTGDVVTLVPVMVGVLVSALVLSLLLVLHER